MPPFNPQSQNQSDDLIPQSVGTILGDTAERLEVISDLYNSGQAISRNDGPFSMDYALHDVLQTVPERSGIHSQVLRIPPGTSFNVHSGENTQILVMNNGTRERSYRVTVEDITEDNYPVEYPSEAFKDLVDNEDFLGYKSGEFWM